jgi:hypothetical protein
MRVGWSVMGGAGLSVILVGVGVCLDGSSVADPNRGAMQAKVLRRINLCVGGSLKDRHTWTSILHS